MIGLVPVSLAVLVTIALLGSAVACIVVALTPSTPRSASASTPSSWAGLDSTRVAAGAAVTVIVLLATRWIVLALVAGSITVAWRRVLHDERADAERTRIEGIARWLEDLRDILRGSSVGAEEALEVVALRPPEAIRVQLTTFVVRRRQGFRTEEALADLAEDLAHPTADAAIAAIQLVITGTAGAARLFGTVDALAAAARDEVSARERVDRTRAVFQNSMKRLVWIGAFLVAYLRFAAGDLLDPYGTPTGQVFLLVPLGLWVGCIFWLRSLCRYEVPERLRSTPAPADTRLVDVDEQPTVRAEASP